MRSLCPTKIHERKIVALLKESRKENEKGIGLEGRIIRGHCGCTVIFGS